MDMSRYTEYLKEKILCKVCDRIISRGHITNHLKSKIHRKNIERENKDVEDEKKVDKYIITWD